ncbi:hypothetical protein FB451DRAFT_338489 [Mycena latifolia]|nr:hypothetical protein FB451DRAFT_338489 [Mycena latifolia]
MFPPRQGGEAAGLSHTAPIVPPEVGDGDTQMPLAPPLRFGRPARLEPPSSPPRHSLLAPGLTSPWFSSIPPVATLNASSDHLSSMVPSLRTTPLSPYQLPHALVLTRCLGFLRLTVHFPSPLHRHCALHRRRRLISSHLCLPSVLQLRAFRHLRLARHRLSISGAQVGRGWLMPRPRRHPCPGRSSHRTLSGLPRCLTSHGGDLAARAIWCLPPPLSPTTPSRRSAGIS